MNTSSQIKIKLKNRTIYKDGTVICKPDALETILYSGRTLDTVIAEPSYDIDLYNASNKLLDTNFLEILTCSEPIYENFNWFELWNTPKEYIDLDLEKFIYEKCKNDLELDRAIKEMKMFKDRNMYPILKHIIYLVDEWRSRKVLWGVGRGSSVSSFVLFLIGINRINPIIWELDVEDFLK